VRCEVEEEIAVDVNRGGHIPIIIPKHPDSERLEHGMGFEPMNNGFAGRRVSHFATRAHVGLLMIAAQKHKTHYHLAVGST
jgi:hypothetical protein